MVSILPNQSASAIYTYSKLVALSGLHFLGSTHGVLPNGPNGIPAFNNLSASVLSNIINEPAPSYNYTLELQGVSSNVTCSFETESHITYTTILPNVWQYAGVCPPGQDILTNPYQVTPSNYTLGFWACQTTPSGESYTVYLRGTNEFATDIGNVVCTVSPFEPAIFSVTYMQQKSLFTTNGPNSVSPKTSTDLLKIAVKGLGDIIWKAQGPVTNWIGDTLFSFGAQLSDLRPDAQNKEYLRLYETMIQGILDYEVCVALLLKPILVAYTY